MTSSGQVSMFEELPPLGKPYLDSSVFLAHIKREEIECRGTTRFEITKGLLADAERGRYKVFTSFFTLAEVRRLRGSNKELGVHELPEINALFARFIENAWLVPIEVDRAVAEMAQEIGATYGLSPGDAVHLASAVHAGCNVLMLWDKGTFQKHFLDGPYEGVHVLEPYWADIPLRPVS